MYKMSLSQSQSAVVLLDGKEIIDLRVLKITDDEVELNLDADSNITFIPGRRYWRDNRDKKLGLDIKVKYIKQRV